MRNKVTKTLPYWFFHSDKKSMKRNYFIVLLLFVLAGCANMVGTHQISLPITALQHTVNQHLPFSQHYLGIFQLSLEKAQLSLPKTPNRLAITTELTATLPLLSKSWHGKMVLSGMLSLDPQQHAVILVNPQLEQLHWDGLDQASATQIANIIPVLIEQLLIQRPLYRFAPQDLHFAGIYFLPSKIQTKPEDQVVTVRFEPVK